MQAEQQADPDLKAELERLAGRGWHRIAAAVVDLRDTRPVRIAGVSAALHSHFEIGSITKAMTGMLLAIAVEKNELLLDSAVGDLQSDLQNTEVASATMRELCIHSSGLPRLPKEFSHARLASYAFLGTDPYRGITAAQVVRLAGQQALKNKGSYHYSNLGGALTGLLLSRVSGEDYSVLLHNRILKPMGMSDTVVATMDNRAPHGWSASGFPRAPWVQDGYAPAGGVISTIGDMARFAEGLLRRSAPGADSMLAVSDMPTARATRRSGMFWCIDATPHGELVWHNGATGGYAAYVMLHPSVGRAVVVLAAKAQPLRLENIALQLLGVR